MEQMDSLFVKHHSEVLIQRVTSVMPIADALRDDKTIPCETHSLILKASIDAKMTVLLQALSTIKSRSSFYNVLQAKQPNLVKELEHQDAQFVDRYSNKLIQKVTVVMPIADSLKAVKIIHGETYSNIFVASTNMAKMRVLLNALNTNKAKSAFYDLLNVNESFLVEDLKREGIEQGMAGASAQTSSEVLETESHPQNAKKVKMEAVQQGTEDQQITRWNRNRSCTRHSTKIEELLRETDKQKVGNLYFYKDVKYMIGSGGSGTQVYIGVSEDGIEVAIKIITKNPKNTKDFENELSHLQKLESPYIVRYVTCAADKDFYYLANQLCEYDLVDYMEYLRQPEQNDRKETTLRRIVEEMLLGLQVLHRAEVIHRDIKPRNVLIDSEENVRLIGFGRNIKLEEGETTANTEKAGVQENDYTKSSDIKAAGKLVYYILSGGKHLVTEDCGMQNDGLDIVAQDLIDWMISNDPAIDEVLKHPYFWNKKITDEVLRKVGDQPEVQYYADISKACQIWNAEKGLTGVEAIERAFIDKKDKNGQKRKTKVLEILGNTEQVQNENFSEKFFKLCKCAESNSKGKTFSKWKSELSGEQLKIDQTFPEDLIGLLRTYRNKLVHVEFNERIFNRFPDFYISLHRLAVDVGWDCTWS